MILPLLFRRGEGRGEGKFRLHTHKSERFLLVAQLHEQFVETSDAHGFAPRGDGLEPEQFHPRFNGYTEFSRSGALDGFLARLHDARHRGVAWLVEAEVGGDDGGQVDANDLQSGVGFTSHSQALDADAGTAALFAGRRVLRRGSRGYFT